MNKVSKFIKEAVVELLNNDITNNTSEIITDLVKMLNKLDRHTIKDRVKDYTIGTLHTDMDINKSQNNLLSHRLRNYT